MILTYEVSENTALAVFTEKVNSYFSYNSTQDIYDAICRCSIDFGKVLYNAGIKITPNATYSDVLKWVSGRKELPETWLQCWYENFERSFKEQMYGKVHTASKEIQAVREFSSEYLERLISAEHTMFYEWRFLGEIYTSQEVHKLVDDYFEFRKFRHMPAYNYEEIKKLISIGYAIGVRDARNENR